MRVALHPDALVELRAAALWYDERQPGLGDRFIERLAELFDRLAMAPAVYRCGLARQDPRRRFVGPWPSNFHT